MTNGGSNSISVLLTVYLLILFSLVAVNSTLIGPYTKNVFNSTVNREFGNYYNGTANVTINNLCITEFNWCIGGDFTGNFLGDPIGQFLLVSGILIGLGAAILAGGFLTSGSVRGAAPAMGLGIIVSGAIAGLLLLIKPMLDLIPVFGAFILSAFALVGFFLTVLFSFQLFSGSGG